MLAAAAWVNTNSRATQSIAPARLKHEVRPVPTAAVYPTLRGCWQQGHQPMFKSVPRGYQSSESTGFSLSIRNFGYPLHLRMG